MPLAARKVFRVSLAMTLALALGYGLAWPLPFLAPLFALMLTALPGPPMGLKQLFGLVIVIALTLGIGLLLIPMLMHYPATAILLIAVGLYYSAFLTVNLGKGLVGTFLAIGFTLIPAAGLMGFAAATMVITALIQGIIVAVLISHVVNAILPDPPGTPIPEKPAPIGDEQSNWIALRSMLIVLPSFLLTLTNPSFYIPIIMKSISLSQQGSVVDARNAGRELLGSTFLGCCFAILFWVALDLLTTLWMFSLWMLLFGTYFAAKLFQVLPTRFPPSFWQNVAVTMIILLGSAVQDSANGKDVYQAIAVRMSLFIAVTLYAWGAIFGLERLRQRRIRRQALAMQE